jgi:hypothetical protein
MTHEQLYAQLRAELLARHFSLNRYTRADHFDQQAFLGRQRGAAFRFHNASPGGITWAPPANPATGRPLYRTAGQLRAKLRSGALPESERWRWAKHDRTNSLIQSGVRMVSLAIDLRLGDALALRVLERVIAGLDAMFHFTAGPSPYEGYMVRWDAVASDLWQTSGKAHRPKLVQNLEFLVNADTKTFDGGDHYLYCTPLDDPRYLEAIALHEGMQRGKDRYRRWEPSMDEYVGILAGYFMVWHTIREDNAAFRNGLAPRTRDRADALLASVRSHVRRIGAYLKATGCYLVRPNRGFAFRGAIDMNPAFEYPVARACHRITGDPMADFLPGSGATFEHAVDMAGHGQRLRELTAAITVDAGMTAHAALARQGYAPSDPVTRSLVYSLLDIAATLAPFPPVQLLAAIELQRDLDIIGSVEERRTSIVLSYLMNFVARNTPGVGQGSIAVFTRVFPQLITHSPSTDWAPLVGLTALDDGNSIVKDAYVEWYARLRGLESVDPFRAADPGIPAAGFDAASEIDPGHLRSGFTVFANAVRFILAPSADRATELEAQVEAMRQTIEDEHDGHAVLGSFPQPGSPNPEDSPPNPPGTPVGEQHDSVRLMFGYMPPLSILWLHGARGGAPSLQIGRPTAASMRHWPAPEVPSSVVRAAKRSDTGFPFPSRSIMRGDLPGGAAAYPLFKNPPPRPLDEDLGPPPRPLRVDVFDVPEHGTWTDGWPFALPTPPPPPAVLPPVPRIRAEFRRPVPPLPAGRSPQHYRAVAAVTPLSTDKVDWTVTVENGECIVVASFWQRSLLPPDVADDRRFKVQIEIAWVRVTD